MDQDKSKEKSEAWVFKFSLESDTGEKLKRDSPQILMEKIIMWAEENHCQIGGGFRKPDDDDFGEKELYTLR